MCHDAAISTPDVPGTPRQPDDASSPKAHRGGHGSNTHNRPCGRRSHRPVAPARHQHAVVGDAVVVEALTKRYGSRTVVDHVSFSVPIGTVAGLIGPNGAGKTTIMAMLLGLVQPTSGTATIFGTPISRARGYLHRVGALIEGPAFHPAVSGIDNLGRSPSLAAAGTEPRRPHRRADRHRRPDRPRPGPLRRLLARDEAAARHRRRVARPPRPRDPRRAHERSRPDGHAGHPQPDQADLGQRADGDRLLAPAERARTGLRLADRPRSRRRRPPRPAGVARRVGRLAGDPDR